MSWRPPLGFRAVVEALAEHAALEEGEAGPGPQPALFLPEEPSPGFGTSGTPALPLAGKRIPLTDGCGGPAPAPLTGPCPVPAASVTPSAARVTAALPAPTAAAALKSGHDHPRKHLFFFFLAFRLLVWQPSLLFLFLLSLSSFFFFWRPSSTLEPSSSSSNAFVLSLLFIMRPTALATNKGLLVYSKGFPCHSAFASPALWPH